LNFQLIIKLSCEKGQQKFRLTSGFNDVMTQTFPRERSEQSWKVE